MRTLFTAILMVACAAGAQNIKRIDQYGNRLFPNGGDLFLVEDNLLQNYFTQTRFDLNYQFVQQTPNAWAGPTNFVDLNVANHNNADLYYTTFTPISFTGFTNKSASLVQTVTMGVLNSAATNVTYTLPPTVLTRDGTRSGTITNGQLFIISFRWHPLLNLTNSVSCNNY